MSKTKSAFFCSHCGNESPKWTGRCPACGEWNTLVQEIIRRPGGAARVSGLQSVPVRINEIASTHEQRISACNAELDRVLGGGFVAGSLVLIGGEPGIGKSTLLLQVAMAMKQTKVLYISGEESAQQIKMRADRLGHTDSNCFVLTETSLEGILQQAEDQQPGLVIVDSIQTLQTDMIDASAGSISQVRECAARLQKYAKTSGVPVVLIGHITKDGTLAGPKILEHMVDTVLQFEGDRNYGYRILRAAKNRFGSASELGIYEMNANGMREVSNPSEIMLSQHTESISGIAIGVSIEGIRPMLVEIQALVGVSAYATPQRSATGYDFKRMNMLLAVLEKRGGFRLSARDVFLNVAGGFRIDDPAADLAVLAAIVSSAEDIPIASDVCLAAEIGLSGEVRPVPRMEARIAEAAKMGFGRIIISRYALKGLPPGSKTIKVVPVAGVSEVMQTLFG